MTSFSILAPWKWWGRGIFLELPSTRHQTHIKTSLLRSQPSFDAISFVARAHGLADLICLSAPIATEWHETKSDRLPRGEIYKYSSTVLLKKTAVRRPAQRSRCSSIAIAPVEASSSSFPSNFGLYYRAGYKAAFLFQVTKYGGCNPSMAWVLLEAQTPALCVHSRDGLWYIDDRDKESVPAPGSSKKLGDIYSSYIWSIAGLGEICDECSVSSVLAAGG
uniref:Uncharacterized protein n=1 Tax=Coccidioides posadasii RMSCC 3488 TaxID=454284 RepID=A0A0J6FF35_COCPO|nr:hypothetical protein CPAG_03843 [Coccidioides posadasii RMSCC 3488]